MNASNDYQKTFVENIVYLFLRSGKLAEALILSIVLAKYFLEDLQPNLSQAFGVLQTGKPGAVFDAIEDYTMSYSAMRFH
jgi:hypothetical protein